MRESFAYKKNILFLCQTIKDKVKDKLYAVAFSS